MQCLLERYGMTETGMVLSNPYSGTRQPGTVGTPLPGMDVRLVRPAAEAEAQDTAAAAERAASGAGASTSAAAAPTATRRLALDENEETEILQQEREAAAARPRWRRLARVGEAAAESIRGGGGSGDEASGEGGTGDAPAPKSANGGEIWGAARVERGAGELAVRGPSLFKEYWRRPKETAAAFDGDGYFLTGARCATPARCSIMRCSGSCLGRAALSVLRACKELCSPCSQPGGRQHLWTPWLRAGDTADTVQVEGGTYYRILGRTSVDIIKCGGFKLSALRIENVLLTHPAIAEVAALGLPDDVYGEVVAVVAALKEGHVLGLPELISWGTDQLTLHELPRDLKVVDALERNAMGKVNKRELRRLFTGEGAS